MVPSANEGWRDSACSRAGSKGQQSSRAPTRTGAWVTVSLSTRMRRRAGFRSFFENVLKDLLVEAEVHHEPFELSVFFVDLPNPSELRRRKPVILLLPRTEARGAHSVLAAQIGDRYACIGLRQDARDLVSTIT